MKSVYVLVQSYEYEGGVPIGVYKSPADALEALKARLPDRYVWPEWEKNTACAVCSDCASMGPLRGFADSMDLHHFIIGDVIE